MVHFNVTEYPTAQWTAQQVVDALPWDTAPRYLCIHHPSRHRTLYEREISPGSSGDR